MPLVAPNDGLQLLIALLLKDASVPVLDWKLDLYRNDYTPVQGSVPASFTVANFTGYSQVSITRATWNAPTLVGNKAQIQYGYTPITWTATGSYQIIFGYFITEPATDKLLIAERFAVPVDLSVYPVVGVLPRVTLTTDCGC